MDFGLSGQPLSTMTHPTTTSFFIARHHTNHLHKSHDCPKDDSDKKQPVCMQPIVQQFAQEQPNHHSRRNNEGHFRVPCPHHCGIIRLTVFMLFRHVNSVSPCASPTFKVSSFIDQT